MEIKLCGILEAVFPHMCVCGCTGRSKEACRGGSKGGCRGINCNSDAAGGLLCMNERGGPEVALMNGDRGNQVTCAVGE